jgi:plasmid maintenance system antidote protein VapI
VSPEDVWMNIREDYKLAKQRRAEIKQKIERRALEESSYGQHFG